MWRTSDRSVLGGIVLLIALALSCGSDKGTEPTVDTTPPAVPSGLTLVRAGNGEIAISWTANTQTNLAGYRVYRAEEADSAQYIDVAVVTAPSYTDIGLDYEIMYYYKVTAYDGSGNESERSQEVSARPANIWRPEMPTNLRAVAHNITLTSELDIQVSWSANTETDLQGYNIYRASSSDFTAPDSTTFLDSALANSYTDLDVAVGQWYYYKVTAFDKGDLESLPTEEVSDIPLKRPVLISPAIAGQVSANPAFRWQPVDGAQFYQVFVTTSPTSGEIWDQVMSSDDTSTVYEGTADLDSGRTYYWKVGTMTNDPSEINSLSEIRRFAVQ
jgi:hypothetical protein